MSEQKDTRVQVKRLSDDSGYFTNVFKKTEKLVSVTFYILSHIDTKDSTNNHMSLVRDTALKTHETSLRTLSLQPQDAIEGLLSFQYVLLGFESTLRVAEAAGVIPRDILALLLEHTDSVQRYINNHFMKQIGYQLVDDTLAMPKTTKASVVTHRGTASRRPRRVQIPAGDISTDAYLVYSQLTDRAARIKTVLEAKPHATVKDIAEVITDVSEKTIQRELNSLIDKGQVAREGERRWSKYSVIKS
ncbi:MAG: hypothetical protein AAB388_00400 [Patescibacteria group bacterium]